MKLFRRLTIYGALILGATSSLEAAPQQKTANVLDIKHSITDRDIVFPESFELDTRKMLEGWYLKNYTATDDRYSRLSDVEMTDAEYEKRLAELPTVIEMPYNQIVREYIERYTKRGREQVAVLLGLSHYYMPIFEQALEERGLPLELKYLPVIESGLDPNAVSKHGATGLWQLMLATGRGLGLEVSSLVDERRDPYVSSAKAADYLKDLYSTYGDWSLAIAAYNCGPGAVNKAIRRAGKENVKHDFWSIYNYLSPETRGYVPMFIAANYVMNYYPRHRISPVLATKPLVTDTLKISTRVNLNQISNVLDIPVDELRILNPQFRADVIPGTPEHPYNLILPSQQVHAYIMSEDAILAYEADKYARRTTAQPGEMPSDALIAQEEIDTAPVVEELEAPAPERKIESFRPMTHKVKAGETLADIAGKYSVTVAEIKEWNGLRRNAVRAGQILRITAPAQASTASETQASETGRQQAVASTTAPQSNRKTPSSTKNTRSTTADHKLKSGETLSSLSKKYGVSIDEIRKANNMKGDMLRAGETIKIPSKGSAAGSGKKNVSGKRKSSSGSKSSKSRKKRR